MKEKGGWQSDYSDRLPWMVRDSHIEILPFKSVLKSLDLLAHGSRLAVTSSPTKGIDATLNFISQLKERGFEVIPHIAARSIKDIGELRLISRKLEDQNITEIFVVGGDLEKPIGDYSYSAKMLRDLLDMNHTIQSVGVGGYPEGHPKIDHDTLIEHLKAKINVAKEHGVEIHINTQACYDPKRILSWIRALHGDGIDADIFLGAPTPTDIIKLAAISKEIGVGDSIRLLKLTGIGSAVKSVTYDPTEFLESLGGHPEAERIHGLHVFTFNNLQATVDWQESFKLRYND